MTINGLRFICSLSHLTMPLRRMPKTFGLADMEKGEFPHLFNRPENQNYVGPIPPLDTFFTDTLSSAELAEFQEWHAGFEGLWNFREQMRKYLVMDVVLLREALKKYTESFTFTHATGDGEAEEHVVSPLRYTTIAAVVNNIFRSVFLEPEKVAVLELDEAKFVRRGFSGGRTAVFRAHCKADLDAGEVIEYDDVCSLYPSVNYCKRDWQCYPVGEPTWVEAPASLDGLLGFAEIDITPPPDLLWHPVLPSRKAGERLNFTLHPQEKAVYATCELDLAVAKGYKITKIHRVLHFPESTTTLFRGYVDVFMKLKDDATREQNPGRRAIAKLCLNSLWGKFGQKTNVRQSDFTKKYADAFVLMEEKDVLDVVDVGSAGTMEVVYREKGGDEVKSYNTNVAIAAWTTAQARRTLYEALDIVKDRAIYCDTDSVVYLSKPGLPRIPQGEGLGLWESELKPDDPIVEFCALGPKLYSYVTKSGKKCVKAKGFRTNHRSEDVLCFNNFLRAIQAVKRKRGAVDVLEDGEEDDPDKYRAIVKDSTLVRAKTREIVSKRTEKRLRPTVEERGTLDTESMRVIPFGPDAMDVD